MSANGNGNGNGNGRGFAERSGSRLGAALAREAVALQRDWDADERDRAAERRDEHGMRWDGTSWADERIRAAADRAAAARDRTAAFRDRVAAAHDRAAAARERDLSHSELALAALDELTWSTRRAPGLDEIEREIERSARSGRALAIVYLCVGDLEHRLFDEVADVLRTELRAYDVVVRVGDNEFLCVLSEADAGRIRVRFAEIVARLKARRQGGSFGVGIARFEPGDSAEALIQRAGRDLLASRSTNGAGR